MTNEPDNTERNSNASPASNEKSTSEVRAPWLTQYRWKPGESGNPSGRPRESGSLAAALRRVGVKPAKTRAELTKIAEQLGMDPDEARNIDVVAGLVYEGITQLLVRTVKGDARSGDKLVGLLQLLFKALDGDERKITLKESLASRILAAFQRGDVSIPDRRPLIDDLHSMQRTVTIAGNVRYAAPREAGSHADRWTALALALYAAGSAPVSEPQRVYIGP